MKRRTQSVGLVPGRSADLFDALEPRQLLATFTVGTTADSGTGSLRAMIDQANASFGADVIQFSPSLAGETITLTGGEIQIIEDLTIRGVDSEGNALGILIYANDNSRHFNISDGGNADDTVTISDLWLYGGSTGGNGGSIYNEENLTLERMSFTLNSATSASSNGGAISNVGDLTIRDSFFGSNTTQGNGGAIVNFGRSATFGGSNLTIVNTSIVGNSAQKAGGGLLQQGAGVSANLVIQNSTFAFNRADTNNDDPGDERGGAFKIFSTGTWSITSTILADNYRGLGLTTPDEINLGDNFATLTSASRNLIQHAGSSGGISDGSNGNIVGVDAMLSDSAVIAGGPTFSVPLMPGSPAINAGSNAENLFNDQRGFGFSRMSGGGVDIGAFEVQEVSIIVNTADDSTVNHTDSVITLREAVLITNNNPGDDRIFFEQSLSGSTISVNSTVTIRDSVTVQGLGSGSLAVDGGGSQRPFIVDDSDYSSNLTVAISGLTIQNGQTAGNGGGIANQENLTLTNVVVQTSSTSLGSNGFGGGIFNGNGNSADLPTLTLVNSTVTGNTSDDDGGGIYSSGHLVLTDSTVSGNTTSEDGGGVFVGENGSLVVTGSTISGNTSGRDGGGIATRVSTLVSRSTISGNTSNDDVGGILLGDNDTTYVITDTTISGNSSIDSAGGLFLVTGGTLVMSGSTVSGNTAPIGAGMELRGESQISRSTISGNTATGGGGGVKVNVGGSVQVTISSSTIALNADSFGSGGGLQVAAGTVELQNTIVSDNTGSGGAPHDIGVSGGTVSGSSAFNLIGDAGSSGGLSDGSNGNIVGGEAMLAALADNGGPTMTHALLPGSSALNAGDAGGFDTDQRGGVFVRAFDGTPDIGAYERQTLSLVVDNAGDEEDGDVSAGQLSLREAIAASNGNPLSDEISFAGALNGATITLTNGQLLISDDVTVAGPGMDRLTIDAQGVSRHFVVADSGPSSSISVTLAGMTLFNGSVGGGNNGGSITNDESLTLNSMRLIANMSTNDGGAIINRRLLTIVDSEILNNTSGDSGGAIDNDGTTTVTITGSTISGNTAAGAAGAIDNDANGTLVIADSVLSNNSSGASGGAIDNAGTLTITSSTLSSNTAETSGGAIENFGTTTVSGSTFDSNVAGDSGGGIDNFGGVLTVESSTLSQNYAAGSGGGIWTDTELTVQNSTLSANRADGFGGGIGMFDGTVVLRNSTVTLNTADTDNDGFGQGGGIDVGKRTGAGTLDIVSTIVADNISGTSANDITLTDGTVSGTNNLVTDSGSAGGLVNGQNGNIVGENPQLGALADNGGATMTHAVYPGSPAYNTGFASGGVVQDQRGFGRINGANPEIGAYEWFPTNGFSLAVLDGSRSQSTAISNDTHVTVMRNTDGDLVAMTGGTTVWTAQRLRDYTSAPAVTGDPVVWADPNDGLVYVAAPSAEGFILLRRTNDGAWSYRNLSTEYSVSGTASPQGVLTFFVSRPGSGNPLVTVAGLTDAGQIVAFQQSTAAGANEASWTFRNISADLNSQGMTTPVFTQMTSYVTSWNQWTLAGLDPAGNVQGVWVNVASFTTWRVDNLSAITGADPLTGELDVTLTTWGGIRFSGADSSGNLVGTWWNPGLGAGNWKQTNMTAQVVGLAPGLTSGQLTAWFATGNRISYAGYSSGGDVISYFWQPGDGGVWSVANLTDFVTDNSTRPSGPITAYVSPVGTVSLVAADSNDNLVRLWSSDGEPDNFNLNILSDLAVRI